MTTDVDYPRLISALRSDLAEEQIKLEANRQERRPLALDAYNGDANAVADLAGVDERARTIRSQIETLEAAIEEALERADSVDREAIRKTHEHKMVVAADYVSSILGIDAVFDELAGKMAAALRRRQETLRALARLDVLDTGLILGRERAYLINGAMAKAGLKDFVNLDGVLVDTWGALAEADRCLVFRMDADNPASEAA